jgi:hypothetical protein
MPCQVEDVFPLPRGRFPFTAGLSLLEPSRPIGGSGTRHLIIVTGSDSMVSGCRVKRFDGGILILHLELAHRSIVSLGFIRLGVVAEIGESAVVSSLLQWN